MTQNLSVIVELPTPDPKNPYRKVFERSLDIDLSISIPYENIVSALRYLFTNNCVVTFKIQ